MICFNILVQYINMNLELPMCLLDWIDCDPIHWNGLSQNIHWNGLSQNNSQGAIQLLNKNPKKINWLRLSLKFIRRCY